MGVWETLKGDLAVSTDRDFERLVLPLLRLFWPEMVRPPARKGFDTAGIDLVAGDDGGNFSCVVQCKGFFSQAELEDSHYRQIRDSIDAFYRSEFTCQKFVLLHNRSGKNRAVSEKIEKDLARLVAAGKAQETQLWDRQTFVSAVDKRLDCLIGQRLREEAQLRLDQIAHHFAFGNVYVPIVPVVESCLILRRFQTPEIEVLGRREVPIADLVLSSAKTRWTLLTGLFGSGKSTTALHAAVQSTGTVIFARCADMVFDSGTISTNSLLQRVMQSLHLFDDFDDEDRKSFERFSGFTLRRALSRPNSGFVLVLGARLGNGPSGWFGAVHELGGLISHDLTLLRWRA
jgi:hypothetical protein